MFPLALAIVLAWAPNPEPDIAGYIVYWGTNSARYVSSTNVGNVTNWTTPDLEPGRWFFVVTAYNTSGLESDPSNELEWYSPGPGEMTVALQVNTGGTWSNASYLLLTNYTRSNEFYRLRLVAANPKPELVLPEGQLFIMQTNFLLKPP